MAAARVRAGFSLVEVLVALVILGAGVLAMMSTTGFVTVRIKDADLRTERAMALQQAVEQLRATPYDDLADQSSPLTFGGYSVSWDVENDGTHIREITITTTGTGYGTNGRFQDNVSETFVFRISRP